MSSSVRRSHAPPGSAAHVGTPASGCRVEQRTPGFCAIGVAERCSAGQPRAAVPTWALRPKDATHSQPGRCSRPLPHLVVYFLKFQLDKLMSNQLLPRYVNPSSTETLAAGRCYNPRLRAAQNSRNSVMKKLLVICFALSLLFLMVAVVSADDMGKSQTVNGWVSDSKCVAKGANAGAAACTKKCIEGGASAVVVTDGDNKVLTVDNQDALKGHEGHHVAVTGHVKGDSIHVESVKML